MTSSLCLVMLLLLMPVRSVYAASAQLQQHAYLKASNTAVEDQFGYSVAISGDTLVVGAPFEDSNATGVNGDENNNSARNSGAVYVFIRTEDGWVQQAYLKASYKAFGTFVENRFGLTVSISGDTLVVGAPWEDSNATGVNGDETNTSAAQSGAAYVFTRSTGVWSQQAYLKASNTGSSDQFGTSVALSGDTLVVTAPYEDSNAKGVYGDQSNNLASNSGAAYIFTRLEGVWSQQAYLKSSNSEANDAFAHAVAISGDTLVAGALREASNAMGVDGNELNNSAAYSGAAYVFKRTEGIWSQQAYLKASNTAAEDEFGRSLAISGETLVVGAHKEDSNAMGVNGDEANNSKGEAGAAYVFTRAAGVWSQRAYLKASNTGPGDRFGSSVGILGEVLMVGAEKEASNTTGIDGDGSDNSAGLAGAAYVFERTEGEWSQQAYLKASNTGSGDNFGRSAAISDTTLVVGAFREASNATGVDGDEANDLASDAGAGYVFELIPAFTVGGMVSGLAESGLVLQNNGNDDLEISANGSFTFGTPASDGSAYSVSVKTLPGNQTCNVSNGSGILAGANVTNVLITCFPVTNDPGEIFRQGFE